MNKIRHTKTDLVQMQSLPLEAKIRMSEQRITQWYEHYDGQVYVSFIRQCRNPTERNKTTRKLRLEGIRRDGTKVKNGKIPEKWKFLIGAPFDVSEQLAVTELVVCFVCSAVT